MSRSNLPIDSNLSELEHVLQPLSILVELHRLDSKAQATADLPKYKIKGQMDQLCVKISNYRVTQVLYAVNSIKRKWTTPGSVVPSTVTSLSDLPAGPIIISRDYNPSAELSDSLYQIQLALPEQDSQDDLYFHVSSQQL